ncbi:ABC transporter substrate-binding protein [Acidipropionibacterium timonense]|uniref:ABC transporter substrate-binding protein n=1 Tax=Acidipropionibacterium timonense TaxID=2161818 RepID=UPI001031DE36|nr:ABC transporter substrate-binding protein [Acidipropionibacterium timonense]
MRHLRRLVGVLVALGLVLAQAACSTPSRDDGADTLVIGATAAPSTLDMTSNAAAAIAQVLLYNVYETLLKVDDSGHLVPLLATRWTSTPDGLHHTFHLDPAAHFASGHPVDAAAVVASLDRLRTKGTPVIQSQLAAVTAVRAVDAHTVTLDLKHPDNFLLLNLAGSAGIIIDPTSRTPLATTPAGSGPFVVTRFQPGHAVHLAASPRPWHQPASVRKVEFLYFTDPTPETAALMSGDLDVVTDLTTPQALSRFEDHSRYTVLRGTTNGEVVMGMNNQAPALKDARVRRAIIMAVDRKGLMDAVTNGQGTLIGSMVPPTDPWYTDLSTRWSYDPAAARRLLAAAGYAHGLTLRLRVPTLPYATMAARIIASDLQQVGITVVTDELEFPARWLDAVYTRADYDLTVIAHVEPRDIVNWALPTYYWRYDNKAFQKLIIEATTGPADRTDALMRQAARILADDAASDFLYLMPKVTVARRGVTGLGHNATSLSFDLTAVKAVPR